MYNYKFISDDTQTEDKENVIKDKFHSQLEAPMEKTPKHDYDDEIWRFQRENRKRRHSLYNECHDNGLRLVNHVSENNILIKSTMSEHDKCRDIHESQIMDTQEIK